jgi:hypothetical protein
LLVVNPVALIVKYVSVSYSQVYRNIINYAELQMIGLREGSMAHDVWKEVPIQIYLNAYIFNVTNSEEFLSGKDKKLKLKEMGPYVYT